MIIKVIPKEVLFVFITKSVTVHVVNITSLITECLVCKVTKQKNMLLSCIDFLTKALLNLNSFYLVWRTYLVLYFVQNPNSLLFQMTSIPDYQSGGPRTMLPYMPHK